MLQVKPPQYYNPVPSLLLKDKAVLTDYSLPITTI